jgi:hypothetical protein
VATAAPLSRNLSIARRSIIVIGFLPNFRCLTPIALPAAEV